LKPDAALLQFKSSASFLLLPAAPGDFQFLTTIALLREFDFS